MTQRAEVRECSVCPPWVVRCAHYADTILVMGDVTLNPHTCFLGRAGGWPYEINLTKLEEFGPCPFCGTPVILGSGKNEAAHVTRAEADAAFDRREAELLGREP